MFLTNYRIMEYNNQVNLVDKSVISFSFILILISTYLYSFRKLLSIEITQLHKKNIESPKTLTMVVICFWSRWFRIRGPFDPITSGSRSCQGQIYKINGNEGLTVHTYVFGVAESESVVRLTRSPQDQGHVQIKSTKLTATKV